MFFKNKKILALVLIFLVAALFATYFFYARKFAATKTSDKNDISSVSISPMPTNTPTSSPTPTPDIYKGMARDSFFITFYGWPDNDPPGTEIAYPKSKSPNAKHEKAGGIGTYNDPVTFASDPAKIPVGTIYYAPYLKKYIVMEDYCEGCVENWGDGKKHIDIWMESDDNFEEKLVKCQGKWTRKSIEVITNPSGTLPVDSSPLFNQSTGECK